MSFIIDREKKTLKQVDTGRPDERRALIFKEYQEKESGSMKKPVIMKEKVSLQHQKKKELSQTSMKGGGSKIIKEVIGSKKKGPQTESPNPPDRDAPGKEIFSQL